MALNRSLIYKLSSVLLLLWVVKSEERIWMNREYRSPWAVGLMHPHTNRSSSKSCHWDKWVITLQNDALYTLINCDPVNGWAGIRSNLRSNLFLKKRESWHIGRVQTKVVYCVIVSFTELVMLLGNKGDSSGSRVSPFQIQKKEKCDLSYEWPRHLSLILSV